MLNISSEIINLELVSLYLSSICIVQNKDIKTRVSRHLDRFDDPSASTSPRQVPSDVSDLGTFTTLKASISTLITRYHHLYH